MTTATLTRSIPADFSLEQDDDGDWILFPPVDATIFSIPGEGWLVTDAFMQGRDWGCEADVAAACAEYLDSIGGAA